MFWSKAKNNKGRIDADREEKILAGQTALITAAAATASIANEVTSILKEKLDDSMKRFDATARILTDALIICAPDGTIISSNPAAERILGGDLRNRNFLDFICANKRDGDLWTILQSGNIQNHTCEDGHCMDLETKAERLVWSDSTWSILIIVRDIYHSRSMFDKSIDAIIIAQNDMIVAANSSVETLLGYRPSEILSRPVSALFTSQDTDRIKSNDPRSHFSTIAVHENGDAIEVVYTATKITISEKEAKLITIKEVGGMRKIEQSSMIHRDNGIDMIACYDPSYRITFANGAFAKFYGMPRREILNKDIRNFIDDRAAFDEAIINLSTRAPSVRCQTQSGDTVQDWIDHAVFDAEDRPVEYMRVGRDITDLVSNLVSRA